MVKVSEEGGDGAGMRMEVASLGFFSVCSENPGFLPTCTLFQRPIRSEVLSAFLNARIFVTTCMHYKLLSTCLESDSQSETSHLVNWRSLGSCSDH
jgi:hypothetical protein